MNAYSMEVFAESHRAELREEAEARALVRAERREAHAGTRVSIRERLRAAIARRRARPAAAS
jgi:hypothetical protein